jgi:hypothetical protein
MVLAVLLESHKLFFSAQDDMIFYAKLLKHKSKFGQIYPNHKGPDAFSKTNIISSI